MHHHIFVRVDGCKAQGHRAEVGDHSRRWRRECVQSCLHSPAVAAHRVHRQSRAPAHSGRLRRRRPQAAHRAGVRSTAGASWLERPAPPSTACRSRGPSCDARSGPPAALPAWAECRPPPQGLHAGKERTALKHSNRPCLALCQTLQLVTHMAAVMLQAAANSSGVVCRRLAFQLSAPASCATGTICTSGLRERRRTRLALAEPVPKDQHQRVSHCVKQPAHAVHVGCLGVDMPAQGTEGRARALEARAARSGGGGGKKWFAFASCGGG